MKLNEVMPVLISIVVIITVAVVQKQSKVIAAVTATMPVTIPLALWIVYTSTKGERKEIERFTGGMISGIIPTVAFVIAIWLATRIGLKLAPTILVGYFTWGLTLAGILAVRRFLAG
jgi:hypothetical protein